MSMFSHIGRRLGEEMLDVEAHEVGTALYGGKAEITTVDTAARTCSAKLRGSSSATPNIKYKGAVPYIGATVDVVYSGPGGWEVVSRAAAGSIIELATVTSDQGSLGVSTDLTGLSKSVTVTGFERIEVCHYCRGIQSNAQPEVWSVRIMEGSSVLQIRHIAISLANTALGGGLTSVFLTPSAGTHTYKVNMARDTGSGTATHLAGSDSPAYLAIKGA